MKPRIAIVAATEPEIRPLAAWLNAHATHHEFQSWFLHGLQIDLLYTGVGPMLSMYGLMDYISHRHPEGWIQAGIGGAFDPSLETGKTYRITEEVMPTFGAEDRDGSYLNAFGLGWLDPDGYPFSGGRMPCPYDAAVPGWPEATGMTSWHAHGYQPSIDRIAAASPAQVESMEGASFFYVSLLKRIPFLSVRAISNRVEPRDRHAWKIQEAIDSLNASLIEWLVAGNGHIDRLFRSLSG